MEPSPCPRRFAISTLLFHKPLTLGAVLRAAHAFVVSPLAAGRAEPLFRIPQKEALAVRLRAGEEAGCAGRLKDANRLIEQPVQRAASDRDPNVIPVVQDKKIQPQFAGHGQTNRARNCELPELDATAAGSPRTPGQDRMGLQLTRIPRLR